jgi:hypothetical protein
VWRQSGSEEKEMNQPTPQPKPDDVVTYVKSKGKLVKYVNGKKVKYRG